MERDPVAEREGECVLEIEPEVDTVNETEPVGLRDWDTEEESDCPCRTGSPASRSKPAPPIDPLWASNKKLIASMDAKCAKAVEENQC